MLCAKCKRYNGELCTWFDKGRVTALRAKVEQKGRMNFLCWEKNSFSLLTRYMTPTLDAALYLYEACSLSAYTPI